MKNKNFSQKRGLMLLALSTVFVFTMSAKTIYVDGWCETPNDGTSWNSAFVTWAEAMNHAVSGDEIWVAGGGIDEHGLSYSQEYKNGIVAFPWISGVNVYGGFDPEFAPDKATRDPEKHITVLKGGGTANVLFPGNFTEYTRIDGFTITGGGGTVNGGGAYLRNGAILSNCIITGNAVGVGKNGGGVAMDGRISNLLPIVENCFIHSNVAAGTGGGVNITYMGVVKNSIIINNKSTGSSGGGVGVTGSAISSTFENPISKVENCLIANNEAFNNGGGIWSTSGEIINCTVVNNKALRTDEANDNVGNGGGILFDGKMLGDVMVPTKVINCIVWGNSTSKFETYGDAYKSRKQIHVTTAEKRFISNLAVEDLTGANSGGRDAWLPIQIPAETNTIDLASDNAAGPKFISPAPTVGPQFEYTDVNWQVENGSPLIDNGADIFSSETKDLAGSKRIQGARIDIGCYEASPSSSVKTVNKDSETIGYIVDKMLYTSREYAKVQIFDVVGNQCLVVLNRSSIDLSTLNDGVYVLSVTNAEGQTFTQKIQK